MAKTSISYFQSNDFFSRLFKRRSGDKQEPIENFLTEALIEVLNDLTREERDDLLFGSLLDNHCSPSELDLFRKEFKTAKGLRWESQKGIEWAGTYRYADIILFGIVTGQNKRKPLLLIESKINAPITRTADDKLNQLERYGQWLKKQNQKAVALPLSVSHW